MGIDNTNVYGFGVLSLEDSVLHNPTIVSLYGFYSGYNGTIYCDYNTVCNIFCYSNGCQNLNLFCGSYSIKNYTECNNNTNYMYSITCDETHGVICPNGWSNMNSSITDMYTVYRLLETILSNFDYTSGIDYQYQYQYQSKYIKNVHFSECNESISNIDINDIKCGDSWECQSSLIKEKYNICCDGYYSCNNSTINSFENLFCGAHHACDYININGTINNSSIYIRAGSTNDHEGMTISNFKSMIITGNMAGSDVNITNGRYIASFGSESIGLSSINGVSNIYAGGYQTIYDSIIYSGDIGELNIYFLGYQSGYGTTIVCNNYDICNIYCLTDDSCDGLGLIHCDSNYDCTINVYNGLPLSQYSTTLGVSVMINQSDHDDDEMPETTITATTTTFIGQSDGNDSNSNDDTLLLMAIIFSIIFFTILMVIIICVIFYNRKNKIDLENKKISSDMMAMKLEQMNKISKLKQNNKTSMNNSNYNNFKSLNLQSHITRVDSHENSVQFTQGMDVDENNYHGQQSEGMQGDDKARYIKTTKSKRDHGNIRNTPRMTSEGEREKQQDL